MIPTPDILSSLYKLIAQQTALLKSPMFAYLNSPAFRGMSEQMDLINKITPQMLAMQAVHEQQRRSEAMTREIAGWHRRPSAEIVQTASKESDESEVVWSTYPPDPDFGFRLNRF